MVDDCPFKPMGKDTSCKNKNCGRTCQKSCQKVEKNVVKFCGYKCDIQEEEKKGELFTAVYRSVIALLSIWLLYLHLITIEHAGFRDFERKVINLSPLFSIATKQLIFKDNISSEEAV